MPRSSSGENFPGLVPSVRCLKGAILSLHCTLPLSMPGFYCWEYRSTSSQLVFLETLIKCFLLLLSPCP